MTSLTAIAKLGALCKIVAGGTPSRTRLDYFGGGIPWVKITDLLQGDISRTDETLTEAGLHNSSAKMLPKGTILISVFATIGRTAILDIDAATNQAIAGLTILSPDKLDTRYLKLFLDSKHSELNRLARGVAQPNINQGILKNIDVPLPPLTEQQRIVDILSRAEGIVRLRREAQQKAAEIIPALFLDMFGDPATNPKGWPTLKLTEISKVSSGITKGRKLKGKTVKQVPYLRVANVQSGFLNLTEMKEIEATDDEIADMLLAEGDVVLTEGGDYDKLGRGAQWRGEINPCIHQNHVFRVRLEQTLCLPDFFEVYLQTSAARNYFLQVAKRTTNLASINMTQLRALPVVVPPIAEQIAFVERIKLLRSIQSQQNVALTTAQAIFDALLAQSFTPPIAQQVAA